MSYIAVGVAGAGVLYKTINGLSQKAQANSIAKNNVQPTEYVQPEYQQNLNEAESMAQTGLPQQQYNNQVNAIGRNQAGAVFGLSRSANPGAGLASIVRAGDDASNTLNAQDAAAVVNNRLRAMQYRAILGQQKQAAWDWNYKQKYLTNLEKEQALRGAGQQNINGAANDAIGIGGTVLTNTLGTKSTVPPSGQGLLTSPQVSPYSRIFGTDFNPYSTTA